MPDISFPLAEAMPDPVFMLAADTSALVWMNNAAENWLQRSSSGLAGKTLTDISSGFDALGEGVAAALNIQTITRGHDLNIRANEQNYTCSYTVFACSPGVAVMIKPRRAGLEGSGAAQSNEAVTMLGRMLAHELKNPLAGIHGAAQLLESELESEDDKELTALIKTEVDRISRLAEKMEGFGSSQSGEREHFNVHTILRKAHLLFQNQSIGGISLHENYDPSLPQVFADQDALMQVVVNLVANAIEAIKAGGAGDKVEIRTSYRAGVGRKNVSGISYALPVNIKIIDNGPGIDEKLRARVFEPFVTAKANGHGLGLALVSKIIEDHGGFIDVSSEPGKTVFSILLPTDNHLRSKV